jgi:hypothetical protein
VARLPKPKLPALGGVGRRIRGGARRVGYVADDAAYATRRAAGRGRAALRGGGRRADAAWKSRSPETRQRIVLGVVAVLVFAGVWFLAIPNLPCQLPGGDRCPPADDAAEHVPDDALAYVHANLDPESEQYRAALGLAGRAPNIASELLARVPSPDGKELDFGRQVSPWLGSELALAIVPGEGGAAERVFLYEVADQAGAERFAERLARGRTSTSERAGIEIAVDRGGLATALVEGFLIAGDEAGVERVVEASTGEEPPLSDSSLAESITDELPDDNVADAFVSEEGVERLLAGGRGGFSSLEAFVNFDAAVGAGAALVASGDGLELELHSVLDPERLAASPGFFEAFPPFEPTLVEELSPDSLAYLGLGDPERTIELLLDQAQSGAPGLVEGFENLSKQLQKGGRVSLEREVLPALGGQAAFSIEPAAAGAAAKATEAEAPAKSEDLPGVDDEPPGAPPPEEVVPPKGARDAPGVEETGGVPFLSFIASDVDEEGATEALAKLQAPLARALAPGETTGQAPVFEEEEIDGVETRSVRLSPAVNLTFAVFEGKVVVSTDPAGVSQVRSGPGGLQDSEIFGRATEEFPEEPALLVYLNLRELLALAEREGLGADPAYAVFADEIRQLEAAGLAVERAEDAIDTHLRIALSP